MEHVTLHSLPRGIASWARGGHTPKGNQLIIKGEPNIVTFCELGIESLRDWIHLQQCKKMSHRESSLLTLMAELTGGRSRDPCCWGPWSHPKSSHTSGLVVYLSLESWETTWYFYSLSWWIGFLFPPTKWILAKTYSHPNQRTLWYNWAVWFCFHFWAPY